MRGECIRTEEQKYKEYLGLYKNYSNNLIKRKLKIDDNLLLKFLTKAIRALIEEEAEVSPIYSEKVPFSEDEMDYGNQIPWPRKYQNSPISEVEPTELQIAIVSYKLQFKNKNYGRNVEHADKKKSNS